MLNNKGFTVIELIASFVFSSILALMLFSVILNYRDKETDNSIETRLLDFKSQLTIDIEQDIQRYGLNSIDYCINPSTGRRMSRCIIITFNNNETKRFEIKEETKVDQLENADGTKDNFIYHLPYISYGGIKYSIPDAANVSVRSDFLLEATNVTDDLESNTPLYKIRVILIHNDLDADMDISIVAEGSKYLNTSTPPYKSYNVGDVVYVLLSETTQRKFRVIRKTSGYNSMAVLLYDDIYDDTLILNSTMFNSSRTSGNNFNSSTINNQVRSISYSWKNAAVVRLITFDEVGSIVAICPKYSGVDAGNVSLSSAPSWLTNKSYWTMSEKLVSNDSERGKRVWVVNGNTRVLTDSYVDNDSYALRPVIEVDKAYLAN